MKRKEEGVEYFKIYKGEVENEVERKIKRVRCDGGGEFLWKEFELLCEEDGMIDERRGGYCGECNGIGERKKGRVSELVNGMLERGGVGKGWWGEGLLR